MSPKPLTMGRLAFLNMKRRRARTISMIMLVAILAFVLFGGMVLTSSLQNGLSSISSRFGADLIVVPEGSGDSMESIILQGMPSFFYFDQSIAERVAAMDGVQTASAQFYLTSAAADCCDLPVEIIGFDPDTDFTIQPWISETYAGSLSDGALIIGSDITAYSNGTVRLYDTNFQVVAQLAKTGTGLDQAVYGNWDTLMTIFDAAKAKGLGNIPDRDPEKSISSVLVKLEDGYDADTVAQAITQSIEGVTVVKMQSMLSTMASGLNGIMSFLRLFVILFLLVAFFTLSIVFAVTAGERKREFALLRTVGFTRKRLSLLLLLESLLVSVCGGLLGTGMAALVVFPFRTAISDALGMPYLQSGVLGMLGAWVLSLLLSFVIGPLSALRTLAKISRAETYLTMREGE